MVWVHSGYARSRDGRFEATRTLLRTPDFHGSITVRDAKTKRVLAKWNEANEVSELLFSPDATMLIVSGTSNLTLWEWKTKKVLHTENFNQDDDYNGLPLSIVFSSDSNWVAVSDGSVWLFDTRSKKKKQFDVAPMTTHVAFSPDSRFVVASQWDTGAAYLIIFVQNQKVRQIPATRALDGSDSANAWGTPLFSRDGRLMVLGMEGMQSPPTIQIWSVPRVCRLRKFAAKNGFYPVALSPDARLLVNRNEDGQVVVQRLSDGKTVFSAPQKTDSLVWLDSKTFELRRGQTTKRVGTKN